MFFVIHAGVFHEMRAIQKACFELGENYQPAITFIVTIKRHHERFIVCNPRDRVKCFLSFVAVVLFSKKKKESKKQLR